MFSDTCQKERKQIERCPKRATPTVGRRAMSCLYPCCRTRCPPGSVRIPPTPGPLLARLRSSIQSMKKQRPVIPQRVRAAVMREFNHLCALCGAVNPQLHHINEDPSDNDPGNLVPLCANHHITDQHNPTARVDPTKLRLFRKHKDPVILGPQFEPLFRRFRFVMTINDDAT